MERGVVQEQASFWASGRAKKRADWWKMAEMRAGGMRVWMSVR